MLNENQEKLVNLINGPILVIAGPGTGKTHAIVERVSNMIINEGISPKEIMVSTFTTKASEELISRLSDKLNDKDNIDISSMLIGNFHSIARELIDQYIEYTPLKEGYLSIDENEQSYLIRRNIDRFKNIRGFQYVMEGSNKERKISQISSFLNENLVNIEGVSDPYINILFDIEREYRALLEEKNLLDYSMTLRYCYDLLNDNEEILKEVQKRTKYILIDEYQDTNRIQEAIILLLGGEEENICVVGDDDQGLYRFRGASVQNLLEFEKRLKKPVERIYLVENYRSDGKIIDFYNKFMRNKNLVDFNGYRFEKRIIPNDWNRYNGNAVGKLISKDQETWCKNIYDFITLLIKAKRLKDYNQVAILFSSLNDPRAIALRRYFESQGVGIYTPKESSLLMKKEIRELIGAISYIYRDQIRKLEESPHFNKYRKFYTDCVLQFKKYLNEDFLEFSNEDMDIKETIYRLFQFQPFRSYLEDEEDLSKAKNLSRFLELIESQEKIDGKFDDKNVFAKIFFVDFLGFLKDQRVKEFENDTDFPDEGNISFLTIHMSKGMEYPLVIIGSLWDRPWNTFKGMRLQKIYDRVVDFGLIKRDKEPENLMEQFDFFRKYYTAFSRAKNLLVLSGIDNENNISYIFRVFLEKIDEITLRGLLELEFDDIRNSKIKNIYGYTSHIDLYRSCPRKYKFQKLMSFKDKEDSLKKDYIRYIEKNAKDLDINLENEFVKRGEKEIFNYINNYYDIIRDIKYSELNIIKSFDDFILTGNVDFVGDGLILDFKTGKPNENPDISYIEQLGVYKYLYESIYNENINKTGLFYSQKDENNISYFNLDCDRINEIIKGIGSTVKEIEEENFTNMAKDKSICKTCSMRHFCYEGRFN